MIKVINKRVYYSVDFSIDSASINVYDTLPEKGYAIEIHPKEDVNGNGHYPVRLYVDGKVAPWKTEFFEIEELVTTYNWQGQDVYFIIRDKNGTQTRLYGMFHRNDFVSSLNSLIQRWSICRKFHFCETIDIFGNYEQLKTDYPYNRLEQSWFVVFKSRCMEIDASIKSAIALCCDKGVITDVEFMHEVQGFLKNKLWDIQMLPDNNNFWP